jgi:hypothetical protein
MKNELYVELQQENPHFKDAEVNRVILELSKKIIQVEGEKHAALTAAIRKQMK